ncbi:MAG TPA: hypothetical protein VF223_17840 [Trebonia sp.]
MKSLAAATRQAPPDDVQDAMARLAGVLTTIEVGLGPDLARMVGAMSDFGPMPRELLPVLVRRATEVMDLAARFAATYGDDDLPSSEDPALYQQAVTRLRETLGSGTPAPGPSLPADPDAAARALAVAWFTCNGWVQPVLYLSQRKDVRASLPERARLLAATQSVADHVGTAHWLLGLLLVVDDEPLIVLHRQTGRGYRVTISGIGDNFQLHTLLAANLIGDESRGLLPGKRPTPAEVAAASDGDLTPPKGINGNFNLVDAYGAWIWNEGRPADIPHLDGIRIVVLDPPPYQRSWNAGRAYPLMRPIVTVNEILPAAEAASWLSKVKPPTR